MTHHNPDNGMTNIGIPVFKFDEPDIPNQGTGVGDDYVPKNVMHLPTIKEDIY
jgi:hypothetical protein